LQDAPVTGAMKFSRSIAGFLGIAAYLGATSARAESTEATQNGPPYFYKGYDYGSQALESPLWVFLNRGFDVLQDQTGSRGRDIFAQDYSVDAKNVAKNLADPFPAIAARGWGRFLREEIFPLSYTQKSARWVPNYGLHLVGGGTTYVALSEWFASNHVPAPDVFSAGTLLASAFVNETLENKGVVGYNTDAIADFFFFDIGGIILFSFDWPKQLFSHYIIVSDWSMQPAFTYPDFNLHNQGNYFSVKWPIPYFESLRLFASIGLGTLGGLSYKFDREYSVSGGVGNMATRLVPTSTTNADNDVLFTKAAGIFLDRNESLLASLRVTDQEDYTVNFNLYPNAFGTPNLGLWSVVDRNGHFVFGASFSHSLGLGLGIGSLN
jgi:hypothetical protein